METVMVTGGAGFIGSHLVELLLGQGYNVRVIDNFATGKRENLKCCIGDIELIEIDICNLDDIKKAMRGVSCVYHLAAVSSVPLSIDYPLPTFETNLRGTWNLLEASRLEGVGRFIFTSSASVYGKSNQIPFKEDMRLVGDSPYAITKIIGEEMCNLYYRIYGIKTVILRLFNVYGPRKNLRSHYTNVIPSFVTCLLENKQPTIYGNGQQIRDFIYVYDVVRAFLQAGDKKETIGEIINFGSGVRMSIIDLLEAINKILKTNISPIFVPPKNGDNLRICANTDKAKNLLGINDLLSFYNGLNKTIDWFKNNKCVIKNSAVKEEL